MDENIEENNSINEEEDYGNFFLQPASSPYNIAEKVQQANYDLFNNTLETHKTSKVKFKEELATYEPDLTDDDVNSIESDVAEIDSKINYDSKIEVHPQILEYNNKKPSNVINLNMFELNRETIIEELDESIGSDNENTVEEIINDNDFTTLQYIEENFDEDNHAYLTAPLSYKAESDDNSSTEHFDNKCTETVDNNNEIKKEIHNKRSKINNTGYDIINCKTHCIERFDCNLSMSIKKLELQEKPPDCPLLKLQKRKCCNENKIRNPQNLPNYNGLRSEYGLSSAALEKRERRKEINRLKEQKRLQLLQEYKNRKIQQNEEVFCQWLKDVARRKEVQQKIVKLQSKGVKQPFSPNIINFSTELNENLKIRPRTSCGFFPKNTVKKFQRPHTSPACVFIEVPYKLLEKGIQIGDLTISNAKIASKKVHLMTVAS